MVEGERKRRYNKWCKQSYVASGAGNAVSFQPERRPAIAAIVPNKPTQVSLKSPEGCDLCINKKSQKEKKLAVVLLWHTHQWSVKGRYPKLTQNSFKIAALRSSNSSHILLV
jgi:hypothetical protein